MVGIPTLRCSRLLAETTLATLTAVTAPALAAPAHDLCGDVSSLGMGVSSYGAAEGWPEMARDNGVSWQFLYVYVFPSQTPTADMTSFIQLKGQIAKGLGAHLVLTFYDLLKRGQSAGLTARPNADVAEADIVQQTLEDADLMRDYYDGFIAVVQAASSTQTDALVQVEPDSWGFMLWAMGVEGRTDAGTLPVQVVSSGHPDLAGQAFPDDAGGFGQALVYLRDKYAPDVRLGWHASNFRSGTRPDVVTSFYSSVGNWDVIVTEEPHLLSNEQNWWEPLDPVALQTNVDWVASVSAGTHLPVLFWQVLIGPVDYHLFAEDGGRDALQQLLGAGLIGILWEHQGSGATPDDFRGLGVSTPPDTSPAGGTAKDLRERIAAYQADPLPWPAGSICASGSGGSGGATAGMGGESSGEGGATSTSGGSAGASGGRGGGAGAAGGGVTGGAGSSAGASAGGVGGGGAGSGPTTQAPGATSKAEGGCGCSVPAAGARSGWATALALALAAAGFRRRARRLRSPEPGASAPSAFRERACTPCGSCWR